MTGTEVTNVTLTANTVTEINYTTPTQSADVVNYGPGTVYVSWSKTPTVGAADCLRLDAGQSYEILKSTQWQVLRMISAGAPAVQVVVR